MALEATLILLDNSAYALDGDYLPTRWESQVDSASLLIQSKLQSNIQSSVGLGLMGGRQVEILCTMTNDSTKVNSYLFGVKIHGELHFTQALQIGSLALKHRANETQKQRIVCFIASTISEDVDTLKIFAKKMKKNGIAVDLICFGDVSAEQRNKVQTFITTVNQQDNSHRIFIEPGEVYLSEKLLGTEIFMSSGGGNMGGMEVDDPELAEAIRMSLQQSMPQATQANQPGGQNQGNQGQGQGQGQGQAQGQGQRQQTEQQLEQLAIRLSLQQANQQQNQGQKKEEQKKQDKKDNNQQKKQ